jgi:hypothetical protein
MSPAYASQIVRIEMSLYTNVKAVVAYRNTQLQAGQEKLAF